MAKKKKKIKVKAAVKAPLKTEEPAAMERPSEIKVSGPEPALPEPEDSVPESPAVRPEPLKKDGNSLAKLLAVGAMAVLAMVLAYYFLVLAPHSFQAGTPVDEETFKGIFLDADKVFIVMDLRGISDPSISDNVMQCGVDFAASSGVADKAVLPMSVDNAGCISPRGPTPMDECFSMLEEGITLYVRSGDGGAQYHSNGMVVYVGKDYAFGTCGIHRS